MKWLIDSLIGTIKSIDASSFDGGQDVQYILIIFEEYKDIHFKMFMDTVIRYGIYDQLAPGGFNRQYLTTLEGCRAEVRVRQENPGKHDWYVVEEFEFIK